ncbi:MAG: sigma-70 family RNA polymerase sigma factor [Muribaculaceae bacterium]|nr:sigma-70 family RNA polymerase sigma factor [Muribaculaceae bacterium]
MDKVQLVKRCQAGDREAFGILYKTYSTRLREIVAYYVQDDSIAKDIVHDGFLIVFASIGSLHNGAKVDAWLATIMKNLSLQYLKEDSCLSSVSVADRAIADNINDDSTESDGLTWEEIDRIITKLPDGYGKVFRLAVLDGLSHKEIGELLGIAPHSSSSQLAHAKAMLRRLITEYRVEMGILSVVAIISLVWNVMFNHDENASESSIISKNTGGESQDVASRINDVESIKADSILPKSQIINNRAITDRQIEEKITEVSDIQNDRRPIVGKVGASADTIHLSINTIGRGVVIAKESVRHKPHSDSHDWALSLAYAGNPGQDGFSRYRIPNPDISDVEGPSYEIEITEKVRHHMPFVIGLSVNKPLSSRWSIESGVRYTFLRSDILSQSERMNEETTQRIHYIGVPLKFSYRMFTHKGISVYGQGGVTLDIPVSGSQSVRRFAPEWTAAETDRRNIQAPLQWSVEGGVGVQYHFTPSLSIYAEPSLRYYFNPGSDIRTIRQEKSLEFTIPVGLRLVW